jgi:hypothetical protein
MRVRRLVFVVAVICFASGWLMWQQPATVSAAPAPQQPAGDASAIHVETRLVLVDTVVTDKKGDYVRDLTAKDFKVWENGKEQPITTFSFEEDSASPAKNQKRYMVLFFDNSTMDMGDQVRARQAAAQFIDANAGPNRLMAVIDFGGSVHIAQNFTADAALETSGKWRERIVRFSQCRPGGSCLAGCATRAISAGDEQPGSGFWSAYRHARAAQPGQESGQHCRAEDSCDADLRLSPDGRPAIGTDRGD